MIATLDCFITQNPSYGWTIIFHATLQLKDETQNATNSPFGFIQLGGIILLQHHSCNPKTTP